MHFYTVRTIYYNLHAKASSRALLGVKKKRIVSRKKGRSKIQLSAELSRPMQTFSFGWVHCVPFEAAAVCVLSQARRALGDKKDKGTPAWPDLATRWI
jgi:hypothetical protein